jgi:hypothetical protein
MALTTTKVNQCLDRKIQFLGYEVFDVLAIFFTLSVLNFLFSSMSNKMLLIWAPSLLLALVLRVGKRGKPENFLVHWLRFQIRPGQLSAFEEPKYSRTLPKFGGGYR